MIARQNFKTDKELRQEKEWRIAWVTIAVIATPFVIDSFRLLVTENANSIYQVLIVPAMLAATAIMLWAVIFEKLEK